MKSDVYGQISVTENQLCELLYTNPELDLTRFLVEDPDRYNRSTKQLSVGWELLNKYSILDYDVSEFDISNQNTWFMPEEYKNFDIAKWVLDHSNSQEELQRLGEELLLYQERNLFPLLCYLKYLVDTMRSNNIVWGVGRGSSVASFVLYKIGVHKINSLFYDLDIKEFLKE